MDKITKGKWQVRLAALAIFMLGAAAGSLALNAYHSWSGRAWREHRRGGERFEQVLDRLQLTGEQKTRVEQILSETRQQLRALRRESEPRMDEVRRQTDERLRQVLTPEQWQQFQSAKEEMRGRKRGKGRDGGGPGRGEGR